MSAVAALALACTVWGIIRVCILIGPPDELDCSATGKPEPIWSHLPSLLVMGALYVPFVVIMVLMDTGDREPRV